MRTRNYNGKERNGRDFSDKNFEKYTDEWIM